MIDGLRVTIRGCDWDSAEVLRITGDVIRLASEQLNIAFAFQTVDGIAHISLDDGLQRSLRVELRHAPVTHAKTVVNDIWAYGEHEHSTAAGKTLRDVLSTCIDIVEARLAAGAYREPDGPELELGQYTLSFDTAHYDADGIA